MINRMRWRLTLAAMTAFFVVIVVVAVLVNFFAYQNVISRTDKTISYIIGNEKRIPGKSDSQDMDMGTPLDKRPKTEPFMELPDLEANYMTRFFIVRFDEEGNIASSTMDYVASINDTDAREYASKVYKADEDRGFMKEYRYRKAKVGDKIIVVFLNIAREQQYIKMLRDLTIAVTAVSLALVYLFIVIFSKRAIKPIETNIKMQKQFITDASHELKTPLTSISTSLDVIAIEYGEDEWTENIRNQTGRMSKLVSELVTLSKLDEELPLPNKEQFSLSSAAWEIAGVYETQAKGRNKKWSVEIGENITMYGEKAAIQQMLSVLIDNAIRYSDDNGEIRFSVYKKRGKVRIEVFNTCHFDTPPDTKRLFDRFYRPDDSRTTETGGNGIGLAIAKAVAETHGGTIEALCPSGETMTIKVVI